MTTDKEELLPCPFCSGPAWIDADPMLGNSIRCGVCPIKFSGNAGDIAALSRRWNMRIPIRLKVRDLSDSYKDEA